MTKRIRIALGVVVAAVCGTTVVLNINPALTWTAIVAGLLGLSAAFKWEPRDDYFGAPLDTADAVFKLLGRVGPLDASDISVRLLLCPDEVKATLLVLRDEGIVEVRQDFPGQTSMQISVLGGWQRHLDVRVRRNDKRAMRFNQRMAHPILSKLDLVLCGRYA